MFAYVGSIQNLKDLKDAGLYCGPRLRKGEVFAYVGLPQNLKDLKEWPAPKPFYRTSSGVRLHWKLEEPKGPKGRCEVFTEPPFDIFYCDPKGSRAFLRILSTEGRGVRLFWALSKPQGPRASAHLLSWRTAVVFVI